MKEDFRKAYLADPKRKKLVKEMKWRKIDRQAQEGVPDIVVLSNKEVAEFWDKATTTVKVKFIFIFVFVVLFCYYFVLFCVG